MNAETILNQQIQAIAALERIISFLNEKALQEEIIGNKKNVIREYLDLYIEVRAFISQLPTQLAVKDKLTAQLMAYRVIQEVSFPVLKSKAIDLRMEFKITEQQMSASINHKISHIKSLIAP